MAAISPDTAARFMGAHIAHHTAPARRSGEPLPVLPVIAAGIVLFGMALALI